MNHTLLIVAIVVLAGCDPKGAEIVSASPTDSKVLIMNPICLIMCTPTVSAAVSEVGQGASSSQSQSHTSSQTRSGQ